jgi:uncharacterized protein DUF5818
MQLAELRKNAGMMSKELLLTITVVAAGSIPTLLAQSQSGQTNDPTAQAPSTLAPTTPSTVPPKVNQSGEGGNQPTGVSSHQERGTSFVGTITKRRHGYVLIAADGEYLLDNHEEAKKYRGKRVKVTGKSNENHVIRVKMIQLSPPM